jgi:hypothetical protein
VRNYVRFGESTGSQMGQVWPRAFFYGKENENHEVVTGFFLHERIISAVKTVEFVSDGMSYTALRVHWCVPWF